MPCAPRAVCIPLRGAGSANILDADAMARLEVGLLAAQRDGAAAAVVHGPEGRFAAGADLGFLEQLDGARAHDFARAGARLFRRMEESPLWLVAAVDGYCIGGGLDLALACDLILATPAATFRHPGTHIGFPTTYGGNRRLPRKIGRTPAMKLLLEGRSLTASEALESDLVAELIPPEKLVERALQRASEWVVAPAMRSAIQGVMRRSGELPPCSGMRLERAAARAYYASGADQIERPH